MSDEDVLRRAAALVRERATRATRLGHWLTDDDPWTIHHDAEDCDAVITAGHSDDMEWIAMLSPHIAEPLAALFDLEAGWAGKPSGSEASSYAVDLARAVLREAT